MSVFRICLNILLQMKKLVMSRNHTFHFLNYFYHQYSILFIFINKFCNKRDPFADYSHKLKSGTSILFDTSLFINIHIENQSLKPKYGVIKIKFFETLIYLLVINNHVSSDIFCLQNVVKKYNLLKIQPFMNFLLLSMSVRFTHL